MKYYASVYFAMHNDVIRHTEKYFSSIRDLYAFIYRHLRIAKRKGIFIEIDAYFGDEYLFTGCNDTYFYHRTYIFTDCDDRTWSI